MALAVQIRRATLGLSCLMAMTSCLLDGCAVREKKSDLSPSAVAGEYKRLATPFNITLFLKPNGTFSAALRSCFPPDDVVNGHWHIVRDRVILYSSSNGGTSPYFITQMDNLQIKRYLDELVLLPKMDLKLYRKYGDSQLGESCFHRVPRSKPKLTNI